MNLKLFLWLNGFVGRSAFLDSLMLFCAHYLVYVLVLALVGYTAYKYRERWQMALVALGSAVVARFIVATGIRHFYYHLRPGDQLHAGARVLLGGESGASFPSGHTIFLFALATIIYRHNQKVGQWFFAGALLVGIARIFVGVHWPYDVVGGIVLGIVTALVCDWIFRKYKHIIGL